MSDNDSNAEAEADSDVSLSDLRRLPLPPLGDQTISYSMPIISEPSIDVSRRNNIGNFHVAINQNTSVV